MQKRIRATRFDGAWIEVFLDFDTKEFSLVMHEIAEREMDRIEAAGRKLAVDGNPRDALVLLRSLGYALWLEIDEETVQYLIREALLKEGT